MMKLTALGAMACAALLTMACGDSRIGQENDENRPLAGTSGAYGEDDTAIGGGVTGTSGQAPAAGDARAFARKAAETNMAEIRLGELALERAQSADVKQFARMMVDEHTKASQELEAAVRGTSIELPEEVDAAHQQLMSRLGSLRGAEFDREYMTAMVDGHKDARDLLESRADDRQARATTGAGPDARTHGGANPAGTPGAQGTSGTTAQADAALNQWASKTLPAVERHLERAEQIHGSLGSR
jgi:putative membrane protein